MNERVSIICTATGNGEGDAYLSKGKMIGAIGWPAFANHDGLAHSAVCGLGTGVRASSGRCCSAHPSVPSGYQATCV
jgi:hypothetical protein